MAEEIKYIQYTSRIKSTAYDGVLVETDQIKDIAQNKFQKDINAEVKKGLEEVQGKINDSLAGLYRLMGTKANISEVLALPRAKKGDVWNVTADFNLNEKHYPAGTNVVALNDFISASANNANQWDTLGGTVDLKGLVTLPKGEDGTLTYDQKSHTVKFHWTHYGTSSGSLVEQTSSATDIASQKEMEAKVGELNTAIGIERRRIDKVQDVGIVAFTDLEASVTSVQQASVSANFAICYAEMQNVFVAKTLENGQPKYYKNWPTDEMYNKDGVVRADKLYMRFTNGTMVPYAYHPGMRKLVAIPVGNTDAAVSGLEKRIKALEDLLKMT